MWILHSCINKIKFYLSIYTQNLTRVFHPYFQPYFKVVWTSQSGDTALTLLPWTGSWVSPQLSSPAPSCPLGEQCRQRGSTEPDEEAMSVTPGDQ